MNQQLRIKELEKLKKKDNSYSEKIIFYENRSQKEKVFKIDLDFLVYNKYNGRILSLVKSYETQFGELNPEDEKDKSIIEDFLWNSSLQYNKNTEKDIEQKGQLQFGIVTKDGIIIDGNRRALILRRNAKRKKIEPEYFYAVILDQTLDDNPREIMRLETIYQMGEDAKVDYNPIEKYLKCKELRENDFKPDEIAKMMGETEARINEYLSILNLMEDYLSKLGYTGIYTRLDKTEGAFVDLNKYIRKYQNKSSGSAEWNPTKEDLNDLRLIYFDYIRGIYNRGKKQSNDDEGVLGSGDAKDYRFIGQTSKKGSFFSKEEIWKKFRDAHFEKIEPIREDEEKNHSIEKLRSENPGLSLDELLKRRDELWAKKVDAHIKRNMGLGREALDNLQKQNIPLELLDSALSKLESINTNVKAFLEDSKVLNLVRKINSLTYDFTKMIKQHEKKSK